MSEKYYIKNLTKKSIALYDAFVLFKDEELGINLEIKLEQILIELVDLIADKEQGMEEYRRHLKYNGIYRYEDGVENTSIVKEIIEIAQKVVTQWISQLHFKL